MSVEIVDKYNAVDAALQARALKALMELPVHLAMGVACSFLLQCAKDYRVEFRRVMNERVIREGFSGMSLLEMFNRQSK